MCLDGIKVGLPLQPRSEKGLYNKANESRKIFLILGKKKFGDMGKRIVSLQPSKKEIKSKVARDAKLLPDRSERLTILFVYNI